MHKKLETKVMALRNATAIAKNATACVYNSKLPGCETIAGRLGLVNKTRADTSVELAAKQKLQKAKAKFAKEYKEKIMAKRAVAVAKLNAAKEAQTKKKLALVEALKGLEKSEEARQGEAEKAEKEAEKSLAGRKKTDLEDETRFNKARYITNFVKKAKADVMKMKIVNPVQGAIDKAKKSVKDAQAEHEKDVRTAQKAAGTAAQASAKYDVAVDVSTNNKATKKAAAALRTADLKFHQETAVAHLSKQEVNDAVEDLEKHEMTFNALQSRLVAKRATLTREAQKKAMEEAPQRWKQKLSEMKQQLASKNGGNATQPAAQPQAAAETPANGVTETPAKPEPTEQQDVAEAQQQQDTTAAAEKARVKQEAAERDAQNAENQAAQTEAKQGAEEKVASHEKDIRAEDPQPADSENSSDEPPLPPDDEQPQPADSPSPEQAALNRQVLEDDANTPPTTPTKYNAQNTVNTGKKSISATANAIDNAQKQVDEAKQEVLQTGDIPVPP